MMQLTGRSGIIESQASTATERDLDVNAARRLSLTPALHSTLREYFTYWGHTRCYRHNRLRDFLRVLFFLSVARFFSGFSPAAAPLQLASGSASPFFPA
jgi:hypothetical protein